MSLDFSAALDTIPLNNLYGFRQSIKSFGIAFL